MYRWTGKFINLVVITFSLLLVRSLRATSWLPAEQLPDLALCDSGHSRSLHKHTSQQTTTCNVGAPRPRRFATCAPACGAHRTLWSRLSPCVYRSLCEVFGGPAVATPALFGHTVPAPWAGGIRGLPCRCYVELPPYSARPDMPTSGCVGGPAPLKAREGREHQRYSPNGERLVAGCIPVRIDESKTGPDSARILMVSAHQPNKGMVFPKGGWETDETVEAAAKRETVEEAGVRGTLEEPMLGAFPYSSAKAERLALSDQPRGIAYIFVMHVAEVLENWPEGNKRTRLWLTIEEACHRCRHEWMRNVLRVWAARRGWTDLDLNTPPACTSNASVLQPAVAVQH